MALHIHVRCGHQCQCNLAPNNCCVACITDYLVAINPNATQQDKMNLIDSLYGFVDPTSAVGAVDCQ